MASPHSRKNRTTVHQTMRGTATRHWNVCTTDRTEEGQYLGGAAHAEVFAPIGRRGGISLHSGLVSIGALQQGQETVDLSEVLLLSLFNGCLDQVIAEHIFRIHTVHGLLPVVIPTALGSQPLGILNGPCVEAFSVEKMFAQPVIDHSSSGEKPAQLSPHDGIVRMAALEQTQEFTDEFLVLVSCVRQPKLGPHE